MATPNVLFILIDDLGWGDVSYHGSRIRTPNIDRLARDGVEFARHYVCPVCTPTRASLLSGRHPGRFGSHATVPSNRPVLPDDCWTMGRLFQDAGYATGLFGKWHLGSDPQFAPNRFGFDHSYGSMAGGVDPYTHRYKSGAYSHTWHRNGKRLDEPGHATDLITNEAIGWVERQDRPWFCYLPYTAVHTPVRAPEAWIDQYMDRAYDADPERDRSFKIYAAYTSHMDHNVGRIVERLKCLDRLDDTIIVFASDNGASTINPGRDVAKYPGRHDDMPRNGSNDPLRGVKGQLYEGAIRTPGLIHWAGRLRPGKLDPPIQVTDWAPTFASLLGVTPPADPKWDGVNIWPLLAGETDVAPERTLYWNLRHRRFAVQKHGWKLIRIEREDRVDMEQVHIAEDPLEQWDLADTEPARVMALTEEIETHHALDDTDVRPDVEAFPAL